MNIFPAIDLYDKKAVRLLKGDYNNMTVYSEYPIEVARDFESKGARFIHMVDLEGAKDGTTPNISVVSEIAQNTSLFVEIGGGIRNTQTLERYFSVGVDRAILGTAAINDTEFLKASISRYGDKIAIGADVRDGKIAIKGWLETAETTLDMFLDSMQKLGAATVICTDISKDGAMNGTNLEMYRELSEKYTMNIIASGGVTSMDDIKALRKMNLYGAIIGKAYYIGAIDLKEAIEVAQ